MRRLGSEGFGRLRVGIGPVPERWNAADFVLARFDATERDAAEESIARAAEAVECWVGEGIEVGMNRYN